MKIGIDINDVLRNFTMNFAKYYKKGYNHEFDYDDFELWTNDLEALYPFKNKFTFEKFTYEDYAFELYGACPSCELQLTEQFNEWVTKVIPELETEDEPIELVIVSPFEYGLSISSTYFFLSKIACKVRNVFLPDVSSEIWDMCDIVITADPRLLEIKPDDKVSIKIKQEYNEHNAADFEFDTMKEFVSDEKNIKQAIEKRKSHE